MFTTNMRRSDAIPQSFNRYSYVQNDPVNFTDPTGLVMSINGEGDYGIIIAVRRPPQEIVRRLMTILNQTTAEEMEDQLIYI